MSRGSTATGWLRRRGFHVEAWVSRPLLALGICAPRGLSHGAFPQPGARALLSNVYTDAEGEAMNSPWSVAAPPANSTNPNQACKLWGLAPYPGLQGDGVSATSSAVRCMLALPTVAEKSPGQRTALPCVRHGSRRVTLERDIYDRRTRGSRRSAHHRRPATSGDGWCPSSKARASGFAVSPVARLRSRHACRRRRKWSQVISSIRGHSTAPSRESTWPITSCTPRAHTATTSKRIYSYVLLPVHAVIFGGMLREILVDTWQSTRSGRRLLRYSTR